MAQRSVETPPRVANNRYCNCNDHCRVCRAHRPPAGRQHVNDAQLLSVDQPRCVISAYPEMGIVWSFDLAQAAAPSGTPFSPQSLRRPTTIGMHRGRQHHRRLRDDRRQPKAANPRRQTRSRVPQTHTTTRRIAVPPGTTSPPQPYAPLFRQGRRTSHAALRQRRYAPWPAGFLARPKSSPYAVGLDPPSGRSATVCNVGARTDVNHDGNRYSIAAHRTRTIASGLGSFSRRFGGHAHPLGGRRSGVEASGSSRRHVESAERRRIESTVPTGRAIGAVEQHQPYVGHSRLAR